jgi:DNA-binding CsgD family transcriptional regulator
MADVSDLLETRQGRAFAEAAMVAVPALVVTGRFDDAMRLADEAFVAHIALGDSISLAHPAVHMVFKVFALCEAGLTEEARSLGELGYRSSIEMRTTLGQAYFALQYARVLLLIGHVRAAAQMAEEAASLFGELALPGRRRWGLALTAHCAAVAGDLESSDRLLREADATTVTPERLMDAEVERARAWNAAAHGELTRACLCLRDGIDLAMSQGAVGLELGLVHDLARLGEFRTAAELVSGCEDVHGPLAVSRRDHIAAATAHDGEALDAVAERFADAQILLFAAEAAADATRAHERAGSKRAALASQRRSSGLAEQCEGARTPALAMSPATPLTQREREVAALAAAGLGNRAISERLFVSLRTVENHLQRIYDKLGVAGRQELSAALERVGAGDSMLSTPHS